MSAHPHKPFPILINRRVVHQGRVIEVRVDDIEMRDGLNVRRDVVSHPGAVVMLAVDDEDRILWIRQHRWAAGRELLELPAGTLEHGEEPDGVRPARAGGGDRLRRGEMAGAWAASTARRASATNTSTPSRRRD